MVELFKHYVAYEACRLVIDWRFLEVLLLAGSFNAGDG